MRLLTFWLGRPRSAGLFCDDLLAAHRRVRRVDSVRTDSPLLLDERRISISIVLICHRVGLGTALQLYPAKILFLSVLLDVHVLHEVITDYVYHKNACSHT